MQRAAINPAVTSHKILPVVTRVIEQVDKLFLELSDTAGPARVEAVFRHWLMSGKTTPSGLRHYIHALGVQLDDQTVRAEFAARAERILLHLQSGYVS